MKCVIRDPKIDSTSKLGEMRVSGQGPGGGHHAVEVAKGPVRGLPLCRSAVVWKFRRDPKAFVMPSPTYPPPAPSVAFPAN